MYESPWTLIIVAALLFCAVTLFRNAMPQKARWWQWLIPAAVFVAAFAIDHFVVTDKEKIESNIQTARQAIVEGEPQKIILMIDADYTDSRNLDKQQISHRVHQYLNRPLAERIRINSNIITVEENTATSEINVTVHLDEASPYAQYVNLAIVEARIDFIKRGDDWLVSGVEIIKINNNEPPRW